MTDRTVELDRHLGMAAQKATDLRRVIAEVESQRAALQQRQDELEKYLVSVPSETWSEAVEKTLYLLSLFSTTAEGQDPRRQKIVADLQADFERLLQVPLPTEKS